ncbi:DUF4157 domain-containing protein [Undibacterium sp. Ji49W]|uniref:eCIS core domain-containing protein n=1 Tax=Undibacterium sp. Ji49W TaxID=3413040 RepID=UPI003BF12441
MAESSFQNKAPSAPTEARVGLATENGLHDNQSSAARGNSVLNPYTGDNGTVATQLVDNRPATRQFNTYSNMAQNSRRATQLKAVQAMMASSKAAVQLKTMQAMLDGHESTDEPLQARLADQGKAQLAGQSEPRANNTGLPNQLKAGIESLSGMSMDHVQVNYNSDKPAQLNAHAYAQGSEIHVAPGQEQHLPHEAWHVVQQAQGRVRPTMQMKVGVPVNDDAGLEAEADVMGQKALGVGASVQRAGIASAASGPNQNPLSDMASIQRKTYLANEDQNIYADDKLGTELTYLGDMGDSPKLPLFMDYARYQTLADRLLQQFKDAFSNPYSGIHKLVREGKNGPDTALWGEALSTFSRGVMNLIVNSKEELPKFLKEVGEVYVEDTDGVLKTVKVEDYLVVIQARLTGALANGPLYRNVGGGSRNPPAEGTFFTNNKSIARDGILQAIGVTKEDVGKYDKVKIEYVSDYDKAKQEILKLGGHVWEDGHSHLLYLSTAKLMRSKSARFTAAGVSYSEKFSELTLDLTDKKRLEDSFKTLGAPVNKGWQAGTVLSKTDRGDGQAKAMSNWNALGVAAYSNAILGTSYPLAQNWEWLHLQGAQIGGVTDSTNLVAGTFSTNSEMIPHENRIAHWANRGPKKMAVRFSSDRGNGVLSQFIKIEIAAENHPDLGTISNSSPLSVGFDAHSAAVSDRMTSKLQEFQQKNAIESLQPPLIPDEEHPNPEDVMEETYEHKNDADMYNGEN